MNELIKTTEYEGNTAVSARDLHNFLGSKQQFSDWIKNRIEKYKFIENQDYICLSENYETQRQDGRKGITVRKEYILTLDTAKELSMIENNDKGRQARQYFIECEKRLKEQPVFTPLIPCDESEHFHINISEHRKRYYENFIREARCFLYNGDLKKISVENNLPYNRVRRVMSCSLFDDSIIDAVYQKAMNNKYSLEVKMSQMISDLRC